MDELTNRVRELQDELGNSAGVDPLFDRFKVGAINAYKDVLNISIEEVTNGN